MNMLTTRPNRELTILLNENEDSEVFYNCDTYLGTVRVIEVLNDGQTSTIFRENGLIWCFVFQEINR